jgi:GT2 family glycosyltransferase
VSLFICIVNHHHDHLIINNSNLKELATKYSVLIKSNSQASKALDKFCLDNNILFLQGQKNKGFGANNNEVYLYAKNKLGLKSDDYFLVLNPDIIVTQETLETLLKLAKAYNADISTINLYKNIERTEYDNSIRKFPTLLNPIKSFFRIKRNDFYDKNIIKEPLIINWAAGSFLLFKVSCFETLNGFDEKYFMYFEDVDICHRAYKNGRKVIYFPQIHAIHLAKHHNRRIFSSHFLWYLKSSFRYHFL